MTRRLKLSAKHLSVVFGLIAVALLVYVIELVKAPSQSVSQDKPLPPNRQKSVSESIPSHAYQPGPREYQVNGKTVYGVWTMAAKGGRTLITIMPDTVMSISLFKETIPKATHWYLKENKLSIENTFDEEGGFQLDVLTVTMSDDGKTMTLKGDSIFAGTYKLM